MAQKDIDIALVQDYHKTNNNFTGLPITWSFYKSKLQTAGIIIDNPLLIHVQSLQTDNSIFINLTTKLDKFKIGSQYTKPSGNIQRDLEDWSQALQITPNLILGGDFNAHLRACGYARNNAKGDILLDYLIGKSLTIINDPDSEETFTLDKKKGKPDSMRINPKGSCESMGSGDQLSIPE